MIWLLITLLGAAGAVSKVKGPDGPVVGVVGDDLPLPCNVSSGESTVDDEVVWKMGDKMVHRYHHHTDRTDQQEPEYRGRTSLSREALRRGDVTLTLTNLSLSDAGTYRCIVRAFTLQDEAPVTVKVESRVSTPEVSVVSLFDGRASLRCYSPGWTSRPQLMWLNSKGDELPANTTSFESFPSSFSVTSVITVEERHGSNFTCMMTSAAQRRGQTVEVSRLMFGYRRHRIMVIVSQWLVIVAFFIIIVGGGVEELDEVQCVLEEQQVCVYRERHLEVSEVYKEAVSIEKQPMPFMGTRLIFNMKKEMFSQQDAGTSEQAAGGSEQAAGGSEQPARGFQQGEYEGPHQEASTGC